MRDSVACGLGAVRHTRTPPGLTGWWQLNGRTFTPREMSKMDQFYEENWSASLDIYILLKTIAAVLKKPRPGRK
jgi:lipopolysaccharide/colanic/teichoic acid biosynthesis glycosyltransferase